MGRRLAFTAFAALVVAPHARGAHETRLYWIHYRTVHGNVRSAIVDLPRWYGPHRNPPIPLVISPHGSGVEPRRNAARWGDLPARGGFAVVDPQGQGAHLELFSWGSRAQIADLAHMPRLVQHALPWLRIDPRRIYAVGASMGGQESLLLAALHPHLLAGVVSFDAPTNMAARFSSFHDRLRRLARREMGTEWLARSPIHYARQLAFSGVPLEIWWSTRDRVVSDQQAQSGRLFADITRLNPDAPVVEVVGRWRHAAEMHAGADLPAALRLLGLLGRRQG